MDNLGLIMMKTTNGMVLTLIKIIRRTYKDPIILLRVSIYNNISLILFICSVIIIKRASL